MNEPSIDRSAPIGLIGIGLLGSALAERILAAGYRVIGFDLDADRRSALTSLGGEAASSAQEVVRECRRTVICLPNSTIVGEIVDALRPVLPPDALLIDTTTGDPTEMALLAEELSGSHIGYVDATIGGSSEAVRRGDVIVMAGGEAGHLDDARDLLDTFASCVFHVGPCGSGAKMKLVFNLVLGLNRAVLAEGLAFAKACGLDPRIALDILQSGAARSEVMPVKGPKMLDADFAPQARLAQHLKDVRLILATAAARGLDVPLSRVHAELLAELVDQGYGDEDNSAVVRAFWDRRVES